MYANIVFMYIAFFVFDFVTVGAAVNIVVFYIKGDICLDLLTAVTAALSLRTFKKRLKPFVYMSSK